MIKRADEMEIELKNQMRGGDGTVKITHIMKQTELSGRCRLLAKLTLEPGASIGSHTHDQEEEIFYILSGKGLVDDNGSTSEVKPGDAVLTGGGRYHSIRSTGDVPLEMTAVILLY